MQCISLALKRNANTILIHLQLKFLYFFYSLIPLCHNSSNRLFLSCQTPIWMREEYQELQSCLLQVLPSASWINKYNWTVNWGLSAHSFYFTSLHLKNNWKGNLLCLDRALLLLYGVKLWLHSDADLLPREIGRRVGKEPFQMWFHKVFSQDISWKLPNHFPSGNFVICCFENGQQQTCIQKEFPSGKEMLAISPPLVFLLTATFKATLMSSHMHFAVVHLQNVRIEQLLSSRNYWILFSQNFMCLRPSLSQQQGTGEERRQQRSV